MHARYVVRRIVPGIGAGVAGTVILAVLMEVHKPGWMLACGARVRPILRHLDGGMTVTADHWRRSRWVR